MSRLFSSPYDSVNVSQLSQKEQRALLNEIRLRRELRQERMRPIGCVIIAIFQVIVFAWIIFVALHVFHILH